MKEKEKEILNEGKLLHSILYDKSMKIIEILDESPQNALIYLLGEFEKNNNKEKFIIKLKKKEFDSESILKDNSSLQKICSESSIYFSNDIYKKFISKDIQQNIIDIEFIYPINEKVIDKHRKSNFELFTETYEIYLNKTLPYINSFDKSHIQWIHNILEGKAEKILIQTKDFVILKNYTNVENEKIIDCLFLFLEVYYLCFDLNLNYLFPFIYLCFKIEMFVFFIFFGFFIIIFSLHEYRRKRNR